MAIYFFLENVAFILKGKFKLRRWIQESIHAEEKKEGVLNFIFCSDAYLLKMNLKYLNHDTYTDVITFDHSTESGIVAGDIFISVDRVYENATIFAIDEQKELHRVMMHGVLHLLGYQDHSLEEKALMRQKEDFYLAFIYK